MKRDNWTNEEVIGILEGMKMVNRNGLLIDTDWNKALENAIGQFWDFKRPVDQYAAMAYDPDTKDIAVVGPPLPRQLALTLQQYYYEKYYQVLADMEEALELCRWEEQLH